MGSGENLLVVGSEPPYEQGLREVVRYQRGVCLRGDGSNHGEALSSCLGFIKQFQKGYSRKPGFRQISFSETAYSWLSGTSCTCTLPFPQKPDTFVHSSTHRCY